MHLVDEAGEEQPGLHQHENNVEYWQQQPNNNKDKINSDKTKTTIKVNQRLEPA